MGRRNTLLITLLSVALIAALLPNASFAGLGDGAPERITLPGPLQLPAGLDDQNRQLTAMLEVAAPATSKDAAQAQQALLVDLSALKIPVLFQTSLAYNGVAVLTTADQIGKLRVLPGVAGVHVIEPKTRSDSANALMAGAPSIAGILAGATGLGARIGVIDSGIDYTHADFGGPGTAAAYAANDPTAIGDAANFPGSKVVGGYDFAGDDYDAGGATGSMIPRPDLDPLDCRRPGSRIAGRGTHMAGLAAGYGVAADGSTYHGPYGPDVDVSSLRVAPGVAPEAQLYALKVFGCDGSTVLLTQAIERAIDPNGDGNPADHLDVLLIALGSPFGGADDPDARALDNAVQAGITVVVAAGDNGNTFYSVGSPASAPRAITVGAAADATTLAAWTARGPQRGNSTLKPDLVALGVNLRSAAVATGGDAIALSGTATAAPQAAGAAALLRQLHAGWTPAQIKAALMNTATPVAAPPSLTGAGRLNVAGLGSVDLLAYADAGQGVALSYGAPWAAQTWTNTQTLRLENTTATTRSVQLSATTMVQEAGVMVTLPAGPISVPPFGSALAPIKLSVDPRALDYTPDAWTPTMQNGIARHYLAEHGGYLQISSVAAGPRVRPAHAADRNYRGATFYLDDQILADALASSQVGAYRLATAGRHSVRIFRPGQSPGTRPLVTAQVDLIDGHDYTLFLVGHFEPYSLLVVDESAATPPAGMALARFVNANIDAPGDHIGPLDVYLDNALQRRGLPIGQASDYLNLSPGAHTVSFYESNKPVDLKHLVATKTFNVQAGEVLLLGSGQYDNPDVPPCAGLSQDQEDLCKAQQRALIGRGEPRGDISSARVPFNVFPIAASMARANSATVTVPIAAASFTVPLRNSGARNSGLIGLLGTPRTPLASAFELEAASPLNPGLPQQLRPADVQYLGVTSSAPVAGSLANTRLYFGISTYAPWSTPNEVRFKLYIDSNRDGVDDLLLVNTSVGEVTSPLTSTLPNDALIQGVYPLNADGTIAPGGIFLPWGTYAAPISSTFNLAPFNSSAIFQWISLKDLALPLNRLDDKSALGPIPTSFCYHLETRSRDLNRFGQVVDQAPESGSPPVAACNNRSGVLFYDVLGAAIAPINLLTPPFSQLDMARPLFADIEGGAITGMVNQAVLQARGGQKLLILHHHNAPFPQAELVDIRRGP